MKILTVAKAIVGLAVSAAVSYASSRGFSLSELWTAIVTGVITGGAVYKTRNRPSF